MVCTHKKLSKLFIIIDKPGNSLMMGMVMMVRGVKLSLIITGKIIRKKWVLKYSANLIAGNLRIYNWLQIFSWRLQKPQQFYTFCCFYHYNFYCYSWLSLKSESTTWYIRPDKQGQFVMGSGCFKSDRGTDIHFIHSVRKVILLNIGCL